MKFQIKKLIYTVCIFLLSQNYLSAQSLEERLEQLSESAAQYYIGPLVNTFGANINSGWLTTPPEKKVLGLDIELGVVGMGSYFDENQDFFQSEGTFRFSEDEAAILTASIDDPAIQEQVVQQIIQEDFNILIYGPSIIGSNSRNIKVMFAPDGAEDFKVSDPQYPFPVYVKLPSQLIDLGVPGFLDNFPMMPSAVPQLKIGTLYGTRMLLRYLPPIDAHEDIGKMGMFGIGLQHNPGVWFKSPLPVDVSLGFLKQNFSVEDLVNVSAMSYGVNVGKTFSFGWFAFTPFAGYLRSSSSAEINYSRDIETDAGIQTVKINFGMDSENSNVFNLGVNIRFLFVNLVADYNFAKYNSFTAGMFFSF